LLRLGRLQYFISQFCNTKNLLRPQKKWLKISLTLSKRTKDYFFSGVLQSFKSLKDADPSEKLHFGGPEI
jgi:hypothetical protein